MWGSFGSALVHKHRDPHGAAALAQCNLMGVDTRSGLSVFRKGCNKQTAGMQPLALGTQEPRGTSFLRNQVRPGVLLPSTHTLALKV